MGCSCSLVFFLNLFFLNLFSPIFVPLPIYVLYFSSPGLASAWSHRPHLLLLDELEVMINLSPPNIFRLLAPDVLELLSVAVCDQHFQIAERALLLWRGEYFVVLSCGLILWSYLVVLSCFYLVSTHANKI